MKGLIIPSVLIGAAGIAVAVSTGLAASITGGLAATAAAASALSKDKSIADKTQNTTDKSKNAD